MDAQLKAEILAKGGKIVSELIKAAYTAHNGTKTAVTKEVEIAASPPRETNVKAKINLPTSEETTKELKRRLAKELYRAELDLANGLKIAGRSCDCLSNKHTLMLEAASEELVSQEPDNPVYNEILEWIKNNQGKVTVEAIESGEYAVEYPQMANRFKDFRKRVLGSKAEESETNERETLSLEEAKRLAARAAEEEVERQWQSRMKKLKK